MDYNEALAYIHAINWTFCKPGLERVSLLCKKLGDPQKDIKCIHVAGTNGKGSTCAMLASVLQAAGYRVGLYTSPHMVRFNERMRVNGENISDEALARITEEVKPYADAMEDRPTEFELVTAIAFLYFKRMNCDLVILETGLGGRLDATNVIEEPIASVITGIDLDHTAILGDTYEKIAFEKAGIIKPNCPVVLGNCNEESKAVLLERTRACGSCARIADVGAISNVTYSLEGSTFSYKERKNIFLSLAGVYQPKNCATVIECIETLRECGFTVSDEALFRGLSEVKWVGRFEVLSKDPLVIYDGGHNPQGVAAFVESLSQIISDEKVCLICGMLRDKDYAHMVSALGRVTERVFTLTIDNPRALPADELATILGKNGIEATACPSPEEAVKAAFAYADEKQIPIVMNGSLYMYSEVIDTVNALLKK